jgi:hypothetical protein
MTPTIFFGYPAHPPYIAETIRWTAESLAEQAGINSILWQDMLVDGRLIISKVLEAIDAADMCVFDLTRQNDNVLFECAYALARAKKFWITVDTTVATAQQEWVELGLLKPIGYTGYRNSLELVSAFLEKNPLGQDGAVYDDLIEPGLPDVQHRDAMFYCSTFEPFEAASRLDGLIEERRKRGLQVIVSDPSESGFEPITWYAPKLQRAAGVLIHFAGEHRNRASLYNKRHAFVAGMAQGFEIPLLMLGESGYKVPFDYETHLRTYESVHECTTIARTWIDGLKFERVNWSVPRAPKQSPLVGLRFGEHVAENELAELSDYFVQTSAFQDVVATRDTIFVGHRGTGKTANATQAFEKIASNKANLAVLIKPPGFEFSAIMNTVRRLPQFQHDYFFDAMWRFIVQTEIGSTVLKRLEERPGWLPTQQLDTEFFEYADSAPFDMRADMSIRLEQALAHLMGIIPDSEIGPETGRNLINEAFHDEAMEGLRKQLGRVLKDRKRVAIFIDNLDKGWERGTDFGLLARLILGLLTARGRLVTSFQKDDHWRDRIRLTVSIFLRSDIYNYLKREAREPDKLPISMIEWGDPETLLQVVENRYLYGNASGKSADSLWKNLLTPEIAGQETRSYIVQAVLPRPRDIVYFFNAAVGRAIDRRHERVEEEDFCAAEEAYSQYAYEALLVENGVTIPEMQDALLAFLGGAEVMSRSRVLAILEEALPGKSSKLLTKLVDMSFLGVETSDGVFQFPEVGVSMTRALAFAKRLQPNEGDQRLKVHRAFHLFLAIERS